MSKPSRSAVISTLSAADLPWENLGEQQQNESAPTKDNDSTARGVELSKFKYAVRGMPDSNQRIQALLDQLQPVQRPLAIYSYEKPTMGMVSAVTGDTVYEPVPYHFKIPHGLFMREATSVAVDSDDNVYVFNRGNMPMIVFDPDGNCINFWGNPTPNIGQGVIVDSYGANTGRYKGTEFVRPHAISVDHEDNLWLTDDSGNTITKCDRSGKRLMMIASNGGGLPKVLTTEAEMDAQKGNVAESSLKQSGETFNRPTDTCVDPATGDIFITDGYGNSHVHHFKSDGTHVKTWGESGTDPGQFNLPHNICMHPDGDKVIVSDRENNRAQVFDTATGKCTQVIASHRCVSVCVDKSTNNIFLAEQATHSSVQMGGYLGKVDAQREDLSGWTPNIGARVTVHDSSGERVNQMGGSQPGEDFDQFTFLHSIATDSKGNLFAAEVSYTEIGQHGKPQRECMSLRMWRRAKN